MSYSFGVSSTTVLIFVSLHWDFPVRVAYTALNMHEEKKCDYKQIPIKVKSSSCFVHSVKITAHILSYYATDATAKCKAEALQLTAMK